MNALQTFLNRNPMELHFMVDIETLSLMPNAAITEIGAVVIELTNYHTKKFHESMIDPQGCRNKDTMEWRNINNLPWIAGDEETHPFHITNVMRKFFNWINECCEFHEGKRKPIMWCKGTDFDCTILKTAVAERTHGLVTPWAYNNFYDLRTLLALFPQFKVPKELVKHNGLDDAILQASCLINIAEHIAILEAKE